MAANRRSGLVTLVGLLFLFAAVFNAVVGILALASAENAPEGPAPGSWG